MLAAFHVNMYNCRLLLWQQRISLPEVLRNSHPFARKTAQTTRISQQSFISQWALALAPRASRKLYSTILPWGNGGTDSFCCGIGESTDHGAGDCCNETITPFEFGNPFVPLSYLEAQVSASSAAISSSHGSTSSAGTNSFTNTPATSTTTTTTTTSSTTCTSTNSSFHSSHVVAIGAGVGVPVGVALPLGLGFLFHRAHKRRVGLEKLLENDLSQGTILRRRSLPQ